MYRPISPGACDKRSKHKYADESQMNILYPKSETMLNSCHSPTSSIGL